jgi:hypothetical protein
MELIIVMIISALVINFSFVLLNSLEKTIAKRKKVLDEVTSAYNFINLFKSDLDNSEMVISENAVLTFQSKSKSISYIMNDSLIIRSTPLSKDSIFIPNSRFNILQSPFVNNSKNYKISITLFIAKDSIPVFFSKICTSDLMINETFKQLEL